MDQVIAWAHEWSQVVFVGILVVAALILNRIVHWVLAALAKRVHPEKKVWRHAILRALDAPIRVLIWILAIYLAATHLLPLRPVVLGTAIQILVILVITWLLLRVVKHVKNNYSARADTAGGDVDYTAIDAISKLSWAMVLIFAAMTIMQALHVPLSGLLAFGGAAGIAVGFAAQNLVSNLFGGLTVFATRIFKIGEDIVMPGTGLAGTVKKIGWRSTWVEGWDGKPFCVPNSVFNTLTLINHSRMTHRTISENVLLRYEDYDKVAEIVRQGNAVLDAHDEIGYFVFRFASFGDSSLQLAIYAYAQTQAYAEYMRIKEEVLMAIAGIVRGHGCTMVLPLTHYRHEGGALPVASDGIEAEGAQPPGA